MRYHASMKSKKQKVVKELFSQGENEKIPVLSPFKAKDPEIRYTSFVRHRSVMVRKLLTNKPATAVAILKHLWDQEYKNPQKQKLMNKYWKKYVNLAEIMLEIGKQKGCKDDTKLLECVNKLKQKYKSLRQAYHLADISWTKFHHLTFVKPKYKSKKDYIRKLSKEDIASIQEHYFLDPILFPLPDKKYQGKRFMRFNVKKTARMYNLADSTRRKISTSTYYRYKPKAVKLQGRIPYRQSCCKKCQNFENVVHEASKYMSGIPSDKDYSIDRSLCAYTGYFPKLPCILRMCKDCGTEKFKKSILQ